MPFLLPKPMVQALLLHLTNRKLRGIASLWYQKHHKCSISWRYRQEIARFYAFLRQFVRLAELIGGLARLISMTQKGERI